jgi:hypothetical protein
MAVALVGCRDEVVENPPPVNLKRPSAEQMSKMRAPDGRALNMPGGATGGGRAAPTGGATAGMTGGR